MSLTTSAPASLAPPPTEPSARFRADIDGLRAIAILLVVAYHAGVPGMTGGFVGVDVFFVISGYLITRNLVSESEGSGRVALAAFWGRRIRRLVPAMALVVVATIVASAFILPSVRIEGVAREGAMASLYLSNFHFASELGDYFGGDVRRSPFLHTWSLGVEEQFYLVWPVLVGAVALAIRRSPRLLRPTLGVAFALVFVVSLSVNLRLTDRFDPWAFYGLPSRAWEFAAAGLLALVAVPGLLRRPAVSRLVVVLGLGLVLVAAVTLDSTTPYPGGWALLPVGGTVLVILAGAPALPRATDPVARALACRPAQWLGRASYSWYLWHWPFIVLLTEAVAHRRTVKVAAAGLSLGVAALSHRFVENPVRFSPSLVGSWRKTLVMGVGLTLASLAVGVGVTRAVDAFAVTDLDEMLAAAADDRGDFHCLSEPTSPGGVSYCLAGDPEGDVTAFLVGDSHARHWSIAFHESAAAEGVRLVGRWRGNCPTAEVRLRPSAGGLDTVEECTRFRADTRALIEELQPDMVVTSNATFYELFVEGDEGEALAPDEKVELFEARYREWFRYLEGQGVGMGWIRDNPHLTPNPIECLAERQDIDACRPEAERMLANGATFRAVEDAVLADFPAIETMSTTDVICGSSHCELERDGYLIYQDGGHLTEDFTRSMEPRLRRLLQSLRG